MSKRDDQSNTKQGSDLASLFPDIASHWHPTANLPVRPCDVSAHSNKKFYWLCEKGHTYDAAVHNQVSGQGCPYCSNRRLLTGYNDLKTRCPEAAADWDYERNGDGPENHKFCATETVHWKCSTCGAEWTARIRDRVRAKYGCKQCAKLAGAASKARTHALRTGGIQDPALLAEWDFENNEKLPSEFAPQSNKPAFWICSKCGYRFKEKINNRANGRGCPCCANKVVVPGINDLATTHRELAREWHPTKNLPLTPEQVTYGRAKKVWWICPEGHEYQATILHRASGGTNCPICNSGRQTSFAEQAVFFYVKKVFPDAINRYTEIFEHGMELDIYIPSIHLGIEYDGEAWHREDKYEREVRKYEICRDHGIRLLRLKENLARIDERQQYRNTADELLSIEGNMYEPKQLEKVIRILLDKIDPASNFWTRKRPTHFHSDIDINLRRDEAEIRSYMTKLRGNSLGDLYPDLAKEWHPGLNGTVTPYMVKPHSDMPAWWVCPDCGNVYRATVGHRVSGTGCRICGITKSALKRAKKVEMIDRETGEVLQVFNSIAEASREMHISDGNIGSVLRGQRSHAGGYFWRYSS